MCRTTLLRYPVSATRDASNGRPASKASTQKHGKQHDGKYNGKNEQQAAGL